MKTIFRLASLALLFVAFTSARAASAPPPNLLIFYADDLGWGELGCQGNPEIPTPHIDSLARNGIRFTNGYVAATYCSPSRAGLLTGRYPTRFGHEFNSVANATGLRLDQVTLADRLRQRGYATVAIGKWHLGGGPDYRPTKRGFDEFYGTLNNTPFFHPTNFVDSRINNDVRPVTDPAFYTTDAYADRAVDWLGRNQTKPWFLYLPFNAQHAPLQAPQKYLDRFPKITDEKRKLFAAMMAGMDDAVGRVLAKVRELRQEENTLIFYIADNGGPTASTTSHNGPLRGFKMTTFEGGPRVPFLAQWKGRLPAGKVYDHPVMNLDVLPTALVAAGAQPDASWQLDGVDLLPFLTGANSGRPHQTLYWRYGPQWGIRHGDLKLVVSRGGSGQPELYNLATDIGESKDLAAAQPDTVRQLQALWDKWSAEQAPPSAPDTPATKKKGGKKKANK
ncbi:MAG: sulfatase-like hydrolase/transferase [Verrucomicrobia bacterium]|nr:sulfatase-like hydrolase/transferase [Verrucomicrobiota bacterium]